MYNKAHC